MNVSGESGGSDEVFLPNNNRTMVYPDGGEMEMTECVDPHLIQSIASSRQSMTSVESNVTLYSQSSMELTCADIQASVS